MKLPDPEQFNFKECVIAGDACWLITPKDMATAWDDENARFRSCIVRQSDNFVVSQGFGKFTNYGERPDFQPWDTSWTFEARHKLDGSLLIVSKYKGELIHRTRGTVDARQMANGHEIDLLIKKYPKAFDNQCLNSGYSVLFEWTTPTNIIVLREHDEPTLTLVGIVFNDTCQYASQFVLDSFATHWGVERPKKYVYSSIQECLDDVAAWTGKEGVVLYSPDGQTFKKIKADAYCELHKVATGMRTLDNIIDLFVSSPKFAKYSEFYHYVETTLDYEVAEKIKDHILTITVAYTKVLIQIEHVKQVVNNVRSGFSRKEQALHFQDHWSGGDWRLPIAFNLLDGKEITDGAIKNAILSNCVCAESLSQTGT